MALLNAAQVNEARGAGSTADATYIGNLITRISSMADGVCNRHLESAVYSAEIHDGGKPAICVKNPPINSAATVAVYEDHDDWTAVDATDYVVDYDAGMIRRESGVFLDGIGNVKVTYTGGWSSASMPQELAQALIEWVLYAFQRSQNSRIGVSSVSQADQTISYETSEMPEFTKQVLQRYRVRNV